VSHVESIVHPNAMGKLCEILEYSLERIRHNLTGDISGYSNSAAVKAKLERKVTAESDIVKNIVTQYLAVKHIPKERIRTLSSISYYFTLKELNEDCFKCRPGEYIISPLSKRTADEHMKRFGPEIEEPEKYHVTIENKDWKVSHLKDLLKALDPKMKLSGKSKETLQNLLIDALRVERLRRENDPVNIIDDMNDMSLDEIILDDNESDNYKRLFAKRLFTA
jgi:DNA-directed RNA polymerase subunit M/transcription elongation factor TFIIS